MLHSILASSEIDGFLLWIEYASLFIEAVAIVIIVFAIVVALARYALGMAFRRSETNSYSQLKMSLGKALILSLEILVAADIVRTVALEATLEAVASLGLLVLIRTFLSWALVVELEGRWPWQKEKNPPNTESVVGESTQN